MNLTGNEMNERFSLFSPTAGGVGKNEMFSQFQCGDNKDQQEKVPSRSFKEDNRRNVIPMMYLFISSVLVLLSIFLVCFVYFIRSIYTS